MEEHFIHCIIQNEFLYNKSVLKFKDKALKLQTWQQIGAKFNKTGKEAQAIYKSLREKYVREKKKNMDITSSNSSKKPWKHFQLMSFLDDHTQARKKQWDAIRNPTDIPQDPLMTITTSDAPIEIEPKSELIFTFSQSSNSSYTTTPSTIDNSNQSYQILNPVQNTQPIITIVPESTQSDPITNHTSDVTNNSDLTKQLITTIKNVDNFIKRQEIHKPMTTSDDQFQSFGRTIAFMLTNIKDKKRQRKAMAELLIKMSEFDSDSD